LIRTRLKIGQVVDILINWRIDWWMVDGVLIKIGVIVEMRHIGGKGGEPASQLI
jgi:hypothetical protein